MAFSKKNNIKWPVKIQRVISGHDQNMEYICIHCTINYFSLIKSFGHFTVIEPQKSFERSAEKLAKFERTKKQILSTLDWYVQFTSYL